LNLKALQLFVFPGRARQTCSRPFERGLTWRRLLASYSLALLPISRQALQEQFVLQENFDAKNAADKIFCFFVALIFFMKAAIRKSSFKKKSYMNFSFLLLQRNTCKVHISKVHIGTFFYELVALGNLKKAQKFMKTSSYMNFSFLL